MSKHKQINQADRRKLKPKSVKVDVDSLPRISQGTTNEDDIDKYMQVLRKTSTRVGECMKAERTKTKAGIKESKKSTNINFIKEKLRGSGTRKDGKVTVKQKIQKMRRERIFPLPKSYTNYKKRNGLLSKNSIEIRNVIKS